MTDARIAFRELRDGAGVDYDARAMHAALDAVEDRVGRARIGRALVAAGAAVAVVAAGVWAVPRYLESDNVTPVDTPSSTPSNTPSVQPTDRATSVFIPCIPAGNVPGKPFENPDGPGSLGGFEGWFNAQLTGDGCESRDGWTEDLFLAEAHPEVVWINTVDNTMLEASYRTSIEALGKYATLSGDFEIPNPDPSWPADRLILIDARTGEVLIVQDPADVEFYE